MNPNTIMILVMVVAIGGMMWITSRKSKQQRAQAEDFHASLAPGDLVTSIGGIIGTVVSVDTKYEEIVIDSEGTLLRFTFRGIRTTKYERPAFIDDDEVDEDGNPLPTQDAEQSDADQEPSDGQIESDETDDTAQEEQTAGPVEDESQEARDGGVADSAEGQGEAAK